VSGFNCCPKPQFIILNNLALHKLVVDRASLTTLRDKMYEVETTEPLSVSQCDLCISHSVEDIVQSYTNVWNNDGSSYRS
jgi:hypothetical protein